MRVLLSNNTPGPNGCGVANFGDIWFKALKKAGVDVALWRHDYPNYLPPNVEEYDVYALNGHPGTSGHIQAQHLPKRPLVCVLFHEVPNSWWELDQFPNIWRASDLRLTEEVIPGFEEDPATRYWQMPIPDYVPSGAPQSGTILIGHSGIRHDGVDRLRPACEKNGWALTVSGERGWLSMEDEIERLAACHLNVAHYHSAYVGQASAVLTSIAARRPVLINSARLLQTIWARDQELGQELYRVEDVEEGIRTVLSDIEKGVEKRPFKLAEKYSWKAQTKVLLDVWTEALGRKRG